MNKAPWIFLGVLFTLSLSWWGMVYGPASQLAAQSADKGDGTAVLPRVGLAKQGEEVYRENGCYYCHTRTATGGEFGYELRLTQLGDNREITDEVLGASVKEGDANHRLIDVAFEFKKVAATKKAVEDAIKAVAANEQAIKAAEKIIAELGKKDSLSVEEKKKFSEANEALPKAKEETDGLKTAAKVAKEETLPAVIRAFNASLEKEASGLDQEKKEQLLFAAYGLSGVELKDKILKSELGLGAEIVALNQKIIDEAVIKLTHGKAKDQWGDIEDLVRGLKTRAGAQFKLQPVVIDWPDVQNGVASRQSVTRDFMHDAHAMPGVMRLGPDLANAGGRPALADVNQFYVHLYQPRLISEKSAMPPYRYLFRKVKLNAGETAPGNALKHADLEEGYAIIPTEKAEALFEFLKSLRTDALPEAPIVQLPPTANE